MNSYGEQEVTLKISFVSTKYWLTVTELESLLFLCIINSRLADFSLLVPGLKEIIIGMLLLYHTQYTRRRSKCFEYLLKLPPIYVNTYFFVKVIYQCKRMIENFPGLE